jgi:tetratricopeptide (TPR) repeat protein
MDECRLGAWTHVEFAAHPQQPASDDMKRGRGMASMLAGRFDFRGAINQAEYYQVVGQWESAIEMYKGIFDEIPSRSPPEQRAVIMGLSRCCYEIGDYDNSISFGEGAIEMNRHFPEVHKYVALSQKATGDLDAAKATMTRAVLYETPWDEKNVEANKIFLQNL